VEIVRLKKATEEGRVFFSFLSPLEGSNHIFFGLFAKFASKKPLKVQKNEPQSSQVELHSEKEKKKKEKRKKQTR